MSPKEKRVLLETRLRNLKRRYAKMIQHPDLVEECIELGKLDATFDNIGEILPNIPYYIEVTRPEQLDFLNTHNLDYRGLIEKGLALEVLEGMYELK